ncbi:MAG: PadR family transcriptional regulator [bacterium]
MEDVEAAVQKFQRELNSGTVALVLLSVLEASKMPLYGYEIARRLDRDDEEEPRVKQGTLYPVLRSLESGGLLRSEVEPSSSGPPRRYYRVTGLGQEVLAAWEERWEKTRDFVDEIRKGANGG